MMRAGDELRELARRCAKCDEPIEGATTRRRFCSARCKLAAWRAAHGDETRTRERAYYAAHREEERARARVWYAAHPDERRALNRAYRSSNPDYLRDWYAAHRDELREIQRARYAAHPDAQRERSRAYVAAHLAERRAHASCRRARKAGNGGRHTPAEWLALVAAFGSRCAYCGAAGDARTFHVEHRLPIARGGCDDVANLAPSCRSCNSSKHTLTDREYIARRRREGKRIRLAILRRPYCPEHVGAERAA